MVRSRILFDDVEALLDSCSSFYEMNKKRMSLKKISRTRSDLAHFVEGFHEDCGTLTDSVQSRIEDLRSGIGLVLMTAHQPNFFAYGGVFRKATLNFVLARKLEETLGVPVVSFFGIADQDFTDDRWVRSCQLPAVKRSGGILSINVRLPEKTMLNSVSKPSHDVLEEWRTEIAGWLSDGIRSVKRLSRATGLAHAMSSNCESTLNENLRSFWDIVEESYDRSDNYSDLNAFVFSKIVNDVWQYDTIFSRFSECQQVFVDEFAFLLSRSKDYLRLLNEAKEIPHNESIYGGVSGQEPLLVPFWYHCDCGSKAKLFLIERSGSLSGKGRCIACSKSYDLGFGDKDDPDLSQICSKISARAIPMALVFFKGLMPSCYVGGVAGVRYLKEAEHAANGLGIHFPPIAFWRPHDRYLGVGQMEALLELRRIRRDLDTDSISASRYLLKSRICEIGQRLDRLEVSRERLLKRLRERPKDEELIEEMRRISMSQTEIRRSSNLSVINYELKILENISTISDLIPSIIDYAVQVGLRETSDQWIQHLHDSGSLSSDVCLQSVLNDSLRSGGASFENVLSLQGESS